MTDHNFRPGVVVAIDSPLGPRRGVVDKLYKNGRFTLVGNPQQYRDMDPNRAISTRATKWHSTIVEIWGPEHDAALLQQQAQKALDSMKGQRLTDDQARRMIELAQEVEAARIAGQDARNSPPGTSGA